MKPRPPPSAEPRIRTLPVKLTDDELIARGDELVRILARMHKLEARKSRITKRIGIALGKLEDAGAVLEDAISRKAENRDVPVVEEFDYENKRVVLFRTDTGEVLEMRPATDMDAQLPLFGETPFSSRFEKHAGPPMKLDLRSVARPEEEDSDEPQ